MDRAVLVKLWNDDIAKAFAAAEILEMGIRGAFYSVRVISVYQLGVKRPSEKEIEAIAAGNVTHGGLGAGTTNFKRSVGVFTSPLWRDIVGAFLRLPARGAENRGVCDLKHINGRIEFYAGIGKNIRMRSAERGHSKTPFENNLLLYQVEPSGEAPAGTGGRRRNATLLQQGHQNGRVVGGTDRRLLQALPPFSGAKLPSSKAAGMRTALRLPPQVAPAFPRRTRLHHKNISETDSSKL